MTHVSWWWLILGILRRQSIKSAMVNSYWTPNFGQPQLIRHSMPITFPNIIVLSGLSRRVCSNPGETWYARIERLRVSHHLKVHGYDRGGAVQVFPISDFQHLHPQYWGGGLAIGGGTNSMRKLTLVVLSQCGVLWVGVEMNPPPPQEAVAGACPLLGQ